MAPPRASAIACGDRRPGGGRRSAGEGGLGDGSGAGAWVMSGGRGQVVLVTRFGRRRSLRRVDRLDVVDRLPRWRFAVLVARVLVARVLVAGRFVGRLGPVRLVRPE